MKVLVFAPHADDEVLGCGGVMAKYADEHAEVHVCVVTSPFPPLVDDTDAKNNGWPSMLYPEAMTAKEVLGVKEYHFLQFPAVFLETVSRHELNGKIKDMVDSIAPDVVYVPHFGDMQKDHAVTAEAVMVAVRPKGEHIVSKVYAYETLSETEWNTPHARNSFFPNSFVDISRRLDRKCKAMSCYKSQLMAFPHPRSLETITALAKYRGSTCGKNAAEAFMLIRECL